MIRVLVPLVITDEQMDEALGILETALHVVVRERPGLKWPQTNLHIG